MLKRDRKDRVRQLENDLLKSTAFEAAAAKELVELLVEDVKDALVDADGNEIFRLQGEARALVRLHRNLTRAPMTPQPKE